MPTATFKLADVDGQVGCVCSWADDSGEPMSFDHKSHAHNAAMMLVNHMEANCEQVAPPTITVGEAPKKLELVGPNG